MVPRMGPANGEHACRLCARTLPLSAFYASSLRATDYTCAECERARVRERAAPERAVLAAIQSSRRAGIIVSRPAARATHALLGSACLVTGVAGAALYPWPAPGRPDALVPLAPPTVAALTAALTGLEGDALVATLRAFFGAEVCARADAAWVA